MRLIHKRFVTFILLASLGTCFAGCGESKKDMMMRAAMRQRGGEDEEDDKKEPQRAEQEASQRDELGEEEKADKKVMNDSNESSSSKSNRNAESATSGDAIDVAAEQRAATDSEQELVSIDQRRPEKPLDDARRRQWAFENLEAISAALLKYEEETGRMPATHSEANGFKTLSWRVELLPYLGYQNLYDKFDFDTPWNRPPNKELLKYIPKEFVSPDRFDESTNFLLPSATGFIFSGGGGFSGEVEDGRVNTILLLEVDDEHVVPWTKPEDFQPTDRQNLKKYLGNLRGDGTFAVWGNGWPVLLASKLSEAQLYKALSSEQGDGQKAGDIHRDIPIEIANISALGNVADRPSQMDEVNKPPPVEVIEQVQSREPTPLGVEVGKAQRRLREVFAAQVLEAKDESDFRELSQLFLETADETTKPAEVFALQGAAARYAAEAGDMDLLLRAVDAKVMRFEVDAYETNLQAMADIASKHYQSASVGGGQRASRNIDGDQFTERTLLVVQAAILADDYTSAKTLVGYAYRFTKQKPTDEIPSLLNRLRNSLSAASRGYVNLDEQVQRLRTDPHDEQAASAVGRFLCFVKGDWEHGLELISKGPSQSALTRLVHADLKGASDVSQTIALADDWFDLSRSTNVGLYKQASRDRARWWYRQAIEQVDASLEKIHVKNRLNELDEAEPFSPIAVLNRLADATGIELKGGLVGVASNVRRGRRSGRFDDDDG